ncbi:uncharacterized protein F4822DRAFT_34657 [Hypoxylon trugodes]|uniref:uncharacterized protein n=1 Tax=Hypoxylon trugodes TaxID=326681 RepID=UPI0021A2313F|nr:uncharacterized protein F4822DRAFT_34657 [Hypoxylon trugodes]KAI1394039.1 hypothetical protein F4822DRAFT_34657 [Hypoxylon trugodes]
MAPRFLPWIFAVVYSLLSLVFVLIIILSGIDGHVLVEYLTINTKNLDMPADVTNSDLLRVLTELTGQSFDASGTNAKSFGLSDKYYLNILTACARDGYQSATCGAPKIGLNFEPGTIFTNELTTYRNVSMFVAIGYIVAAGLSGLSFIFTILSRCSSRIIVASQLTSGIAFLLLLATGIASAVEFTKLRDLFERVLGGSGLKTSVSARIFGLTFGAAFMTLAALLLAISISRSSRPLQRYGDFNDQGRSLGNIANEPAPVPQPGFIRRMTTWNRQKYMEVERQRPIFHKDSHHDDDREGLIATVENDFSHEYPNDIAMGPMQDHKGPSRDPSAAYDPYASTEYTPQVATPSNPYRA